MATEDADAGADIDAEQYEQQKQRMHLFDPASPVEAMPARSSSHGSNAPPYGGASSGQRNFDGDGDGAMDNTETPTSLKEATTSTAGMGLQTATDESEHEHDEQDRETRIGSSQRGPSPSLADID